MREKKKEKEREKLEDLSIASSGFYISFSFFPTKTFIQNVALIGSYGLE